MRQTPVGNHCPQPHIAGDSLVAFAAVIYALFLIGSRASIRWQGWLRYGDISRSRAALVAGRSDLSRAADHLDVLHGQAQRKLYWF